MNVIRSIKASSVLALALVAVSSGASLANAQEVQGKFTLPYETHWGGSVLKPGDYSFRVSLNEDYPRYAMVISEQDHQSTIIMASTRGPMAFGKSMLIVERQKYQLTVRSLHLGEAGLVIYFPAAKDRPPVLAQGPKLLQRIPILMASK